MSCHPGSSRRRFARLASSLAVLIPLGASAGSVGIDYDIYLAGFPIGVATMEARLDSDRYQVEMRARLTGLAGVLTSGKGGASASGVLSGSRPVPSAFAVTSSTSQGWRVLRMSLAAGNVQAVEIKPPLDDWDRPDRVPVTDTHKKSVIDPLSALLVPVAGNGAGEAAACSRSIPLFDGATRFNIVLSYAGTKTVSAEGYSGPVAVCSIRYVPIAGHRPLRSVTKFMESNDEMEAWLAPIAGTNVFVPYRISVKTLAGTTVVEASRFQIDAATTAAQARPARAKN